MNSIKEAEVKEWVIENLFAMEGDHLSEGQREAFVDFLKAWGTSPFILDCYMEFRSRSRSP